MTSSGWRGFLNLNSWLLVIFAGSYFVGDRATAAGWFDVGAMLSDAAVPVGVVMGFGITYAADAWGRRVARHGLDREAETAALVGVYFFASLVALGAILAHSGWPEGRTWCLPWVCEAALPLGVSVDPFDPLHTIGKVGVIAVAWVVLGAVPVAAVLVRPPRPQAESTLPSAAVGARVGARGVDLALLGVFIYGAYVYGPGVLTGVCVPATDVCVPWTAARWVLVVVPPLLVFGYELVPLVTGAQSVGKRLFRIRVETIPNCRAPVMRCVLRAATTAALTPLVVEFPVLVATGRGYLGLVEPRMLALMVLLVAVMAHAERRGLHDLVAGTRVVRSLPPSTCGVQVPGEVVPRTTSGPRVPPAEFVATPEAPFVNDKLGRRTHVEAVCGWMETSVGHPMILLDGGWGSGKTAFVTMCYAYLRSRGVQTVRYNAWQSSYTQDPLLDLVTAITTDLPSSKPLAATASRLVGIRSWLSSPDPERAPIPDPDDIYRTSTDFKDQLAGTTAAGGGRLVILIDELDRCRPPFAVATLEAARNLFAVDGVTVLVATNRRELCEAVKGLYGDGFDADRYLRRFADLPVRLQRPSPEHENEFVQTLIDAAALSDHLGKNPVVHGILPLILDLPDSHLRDLQQATSLAYITLQSDPPTTYAPGLWETSVLALVVTRMAAPTIYEQLAGNQIDGFTAVAAVTKHLPPPPPITRPASLLGRARFEAALVNLNSYTDWRLESSLDFTTRYAQTVDGTPQHADTVRRQLDRLLGTLPANPFVPLEAHTIRQLIELFSYPPEAATSQKNDL